MRTTDDTLLYLDNTARKTQYFTYYLAALVSLITFLVYLRSLQNDFVMWDDNRYIIENPHIRSFNLDFFRWAFFEFYSSNWHPLTWITHAVDYDIWGMNPLGHHLTNNIFHAANTFIVVLLISRLLEIYKERKRTKGTITFLDDKSILIAGGVTGLLFGLHPLHVESVAWVAERKDLLCAFFYLLSITAYTKYMRAINTGSGSQNSGPRFLHKQYLFSLAFFIFALLSKPMAVSLPAVLLITDLYPSGRIMSLKSFWSAFVEKLPFISLSLISSLLTILAQKTGSAMEMMSFLPLSTRLYVAANALISYLGKMILPLNLVPFYPYPKFTAIPFLTYILPMALVAGITLACAVTAKKQKIFLAVWGYYFITLIPVIGLVQVGNQAMADRYTYLPALGPFLLMGLAVAWVLGKVNSLQRLGSGARILTVAVVAILVISMTYMTVRQIGVWKTNFIFWDYIIEKEPESVPMAYIYRGSEYEKIGQLDRAIDDYNRAITLDPYNYTAYNYAGMLYGKTGRLSRAIEFFNKSIAIKPDYANAYFHLGIAYTLAYQNDSALEAFNNAILLNKDDAQEHLYRGSLYARLGNRELALSDFQRACALGEKQGCEASMGVQFGIK